MNASRRFFSRRFIVSAALLLVAAAGLPTTLAVLQEHFRKEPIELAKRLQELDRDAFPSFRYDGSVQTVLALDEWLGTDDWVSYGYRLKNPATPEEGWLRVTLFAAFYNDPGETVPHTPEVCYKQSGWEVRSTTRIPVEVDGIGSADAHLVDVSLGDERVIVLYFLVHNGKLFRTREEVRFALGWPGDPYMYFSKVEAIVACPPDVPVEACVDTARLMMEEAMPQLLEVHYPDTRGDS